MSEQGSDHHTGDLPEHGKDLSIVPAAANEFGDDGHHSEPEVKQITLKRLSSQSSWEDIVFGDTPAQAAPAQRHFPSMVAVIGLAALIGAMSGVGSGWWSASHFGHEDQSKLAATERNRSIDNAIAQVHSELQTLKTAAESATKANASKLAKLGETLDKLKSSEATGSISPAPAPAPAPAVAAPAPQIARLPTIDGWVLRDVANGGALIEGREGVFEVYAGDPVPGIGRVDAIRRQDGRWVVVTSRGLIVAR